MFVKGYAANWSEEIFVIKEIQNTVPWKYVTIDLNSEEIIGTFFDKELKKIDQREFGIKKVIKKNGKGMIIHLIAGLIRKTYHK